MKLEKKINLLFGIIGGLFLVFLQPIFYLSVNLNLIGHTVGFIVRSIIELISLVAIIIVIYFSILLIVDTIKTIHRK